MKDQFARNGQSMLFGAGLTLAGIIVGASLFGERQTAAFADSGGSKASFALPAITLTPTDRVLVKNRSGLYMMIDTRGNVAPLHLKDTDLRSAPGESLLMAP